MSEEQELKELNLKVKEVLKKVDATMKDISEIRFVLVGNELKPDGIVNEINDVKTKVEHIEKYIDGQKMLSKVGITLVSVLGIKFIIDVLTFFFHNK